MELWDLSLVDPDNRRPVDYRGRRRMLGALKRAVARTDADEPVTDGDDSAPLRRLARRLADDWTDGRIKLFLTWQALQLRREHPALFQHGEYLPLIADGPHHEHLIGFLRQHEDAQIVVAVPRLVGRLLDAPSDGAEAGTLRFRAGVWDDTTLLLPDPPGQRYRSTFTGAVVETVEAGGSVSQSALPVGTLLADFPVILLVRETP
jgi:(1->4)-alpha-D-glucan 1-alpha-D-glucosylmutase